MFDFLKRKKKNEEIVQESISDKADIENNEEKSAFFNRLKKGLSKTRSAFSSQLANLFLGKKELTKDLLEQIETILLSADVGIETTQLLIKNLTGQLSRKALNDTETAFQLLKDDLKNILKTCELPMNADEANPFVILVIGINGSGKTTTIGKLAHFYQTHGKKVMLAAGDTFRAAAIEQLQAWGNRNQIPVIAQKPKADTAAVIFDAFEAAKARNIDILLADTAGRLHTQGHLMAELEKVKRVIGKIDPKAPHEVLIVLDATIGQNALNQVKQFNDALGVTGIILTKLDGTAKGGVIFSIASHIKIPIRFIGLGESIDDLKPFNADEFVDALFA